MIHETKKKSISPIHWLNILRTKKKFRRQCNFFFFFIFWTRISHWCLLFLSKCKKYFVHRYYGYIFQTMITFFIFMFVRYFCIWKKNSIDQITRPGKMLIIFWCIFLENSRSFFTSRYHLNFTTCLALWLGGTKNYHWFLRQSNFS